MTASCRHLGNPLSGQRAADVFFCRHFEDQCTLSGGVPGLRNCSNCSDFLPADRNASTRAIASSPEEIIVDVAANTAGDWWKECSIVITAWKRPKAVRRLLQSIDRYSPSGCCVKVIDTGGNLSRARNEIATKVKRPFTVLLEDDFVLTKDTRIDRLFDVVAGDGSISGAGGWTWEPAVSGTAGRGQRVLWCRDFVRHNDRCYLAPPARPPRKIGGTRYKPCDLILNFGVFRTDLFRDVRHDENLPVQEHTDFFYRAAKSGHQFAYVPTVGIDHIRDRPSGSYTVARGRDFTQYLREKHGFRFEKDAAHAPRIDRPNVVVLTVGRTGSSVTTRMLHELGWSIGDADDEYCESVDVRNVNVKWQKTRTFDARHARRALFTLPQPWVVKEPRFKMTLDIWRNAGVFDRYQPALVFLTKDEATVKASHARKDWLYDPDNLLSCHRMYERWPWQKIKVDAQQIANAAALFDLTRTPAGPHPSVGRPEQT